MCISAKGLPYQMGFPDMIMQRGDIHHIFPKEYLRGEGLTRSDYNQIANYAYTQSEINIKIRKKSPKEYFKDVFEQCNGGKLIYDGINNIEQLKENLSSLYSGRISHYVSR
jgi:hypothetical protein